MAVAAASSTTLQHILPWRDMYRQEMSCQIIHDSIHSRPGWTNEYLLRLDEVAVGYGSIAVSGPWTDKPTVYEFYVAPLYRSQMFDLFDVLLQCSQAAMIETQSNDPLLTAMLHAYARNVVSESILFHDRLTTHYSPAGATLRPASADDPARQSPAEPTWDWVVEVDGTIAAAGGVLWHYNRPYGDIFMEVAEPFRRRGLGAYLVQELKRLCYEHGSVPSARCNVTNTASRKTLQKAGFVPCGHILNGSLAGSLSG